MTYEELVKIAVETQHNLVSYDTGDIKGNDGDMQLYIKWCTGGMSGGNCWDDTTPYPTSGDDEPEFVLLDKILENVAPAITMMQYKAITRLITLTDESEYEYYGNSSNYDIKTISLKLIYDNLVEWGYV
jgi:hypothetical protein